MKLLLISLDPILSLSQSRRLSEIIKWSNPADTLGLRFCLTACSMVQDSYREGYEAKIDFYSNFIDEDLAEISFADLEALNMNLHMFPFTGRSGPHPGIWLPDGHDPGSPTVVLLHMAYRALPVICFELNYDIKQGKAKNTHLYPNTPTSLPAAFPLPPTAFTIPFSSFMNIPLPFSLGCAEMFSTCHLPAMTTAAFIESSEWTGYFGARLQRPLHDMARPRFDLPMNGVRFSVVQKDGDSGVVKLHSGALSDHKGNFYLEGELWTASGKINLTRRHESFPSVLRLQALMTPFGIVASWGVAEGYWMWLWKSEWSAGLVEW
jgi:hypothetical protein